MASDKRPPENGIWKFPSIPAHSLPIILKQLPSDSKSHQGLGLKHSHSVSSNSCFIRNELLQVISLLIIERHQEKQIMASQSKQRRYRKLKRTQIFWKIKEDITSIKQHQNVIKKRTENKRVPGKLKIELLKLKIQ